MRSPCGGLASANIASRPAMPLTTQEMPAPLRMPSTQVLQARQRRIGSPLRSLLTHCGSATSVRPSAMKSALPLSTACVADRRIAEPADRDHRHVDRLLHVGGEMQKRRVRVRHRRDHAMRVGLGAVMPGGDVQRVGAGLRRPDRDASCPRRRSARRRNSPRPTAGRSRRASGTAAFTARSMSRPKRARFSSEPPYSSVRRFSNGAWNCEIR